jgi:3-oxoacid CoA-transferase subunit A
MNKVFLDAASALADIVKDNQTIAVGGFGLCGIPEALIAALRDSGVKGLTAISNNAGVDGFGSGQLLTTRQIRKMISSYVGENKEFERRIWQANWNSHRKERWLKNCVPAARVFPRSSLRTGVGTIVAEGKEIREFDGKQYVMERSLVADVSLVKAWKADKAGNLVYRKPRVTSIRMWQWQAKSRWWKWKSWWKPAASIRMKCIHRAFSCTASP